MTDQSALIDMTADIVSAFVSNHSVRAAELPELIATVHASLSGISAPKPAEEQVAELKPAVPVKKSVADDYIVCLEDGKKFKSLKRHLQQAFGMTPDDYRAKWGLPRDYPMVAPGYAAKRSALAKAAGLGSARRQAEPAAEMAEEAIPEQEDAAPAIEPDAEAVEAEASEAVAPPAKRRGRPKKAA